MPIFRKDEMEATPDVARPHIKMIQYAGDLLKVGIVTYKKGDVPPPHYHPNDEQWIYILSGKLAVLLGDETTTADAGDLIFIPRNTVHGQTLTRSFAVETHHARLMRQTSQVIHRVPASR